MVDTRLDLAQVKYDSSLNGAYDYMAALFAKASNSRLKDSSLVPRALPRIFAR